LNQEYLSKALKAQMIIKLVSTKNLSQKIDSCGWGPGPDDLSQKCLDLFQS